MKKEIIFWTSLTIILMMFALAEAKQCALFNLKGNGSDSASWDADIPSTVFAANPNGLSWINIWAVNPAGKPTHADVLACFHDSIALPGIKVLPDAAANGIIKSRAPATDINVINKISPPTAPPPKKSAVEKAREHAIRSWRWVPELFQTAIAWAASASDSLARADNADLGANWDGGYGLDSCSIVSNAATGTNSGVACLEVYNAFTPTNDQAAQATVSDMSGTVIGDTAAVGVRLANPPTMAMYLCRAQTAEAIPVATTTRIQKRTPTGNFQVAVENANSWLANDVLRLEVTGGSPANLNCYRNGGSPLLTWSDANDGSTGTVITSGKGGIMVSVTSGTLGLRNFEISDLGVAPGVVAKRRVILW